MLASYSLAAMAAAVALFSETVFAQKGVCQSAPYNALTCLSGVEEAISACSEVPQQTKTVTITTTTLDIVTYSTTQAAASQNQVTVNVTQTENRTETVTEGPLSTITNIQISTYSEGAAVTTYVPCSVLSTASAAVSAAPIAGEETCNAVDALPALASITANDTLATACSCMGNPAATTTITETVNAPAVEATTTAVDGTPKTTTLYAITQVTITETVAPVTTIAVSSATTVTGSSTVSLAAPTYTSVFGPKAGCVNVNVGPAEALPAEVTTMPEAITQCKEICDQEPSCKFLYVQKVFENWGGREPHFVCEMNTKFFKQRRDLRCGQKASIFGKARGFDARGRGVPEEPAPAPEATSAAGSASESAAPAASTTASLAVEPTVSEAAVASETPLAWSPEAGSGA